MGSKVRINWKVSIPLIGIICFVIYWTTMSFSQEQQVPLPESIKDIHRQLGDGEPKRRRRPDLHENMHYNNIPSEFPIKKKADTLKTEHRLRNSHRLHVAIVACGDRANSAIVSLKSFIMFTKQLLHFHIFTEENLKAHFHTALSKWPAVESGQLIFDIDRVQFPLVKNPKVWKSMFKPCACQRLFLPMLLKDVNSVLYVDTDVLTLTPLEKIWNFFSLFNSTQLTGLVPESEANTPGWYSRFGRHPYYGKQGLNSGVMLMNLTRMRKVNMVHMLIPIYEKYKYDIVWGDQDLLNILFHLHPEMVYLISCNWNYRPDHCMYGSNCRSAEKKGVYLLHGSRDVFHNNKQPEFKVLYGAFEQYDLVKGTIDSLKTAIQRGLEKFKSTYCGETSDVFFKAIQTQ